MNTATPVPSRPPTALITGRRRTRRSAAIRTESPTATAAAGSSPASALTVTKATGPTPVSTIARRSRSISSGSGGSGGPPGGSGLRLGGGKHQVVEELGREAALEQAAIDSLQEQGAPGRVVDPGHRDALRVRAGLQRSVEPAEPVRQQLLAAHAHAGEPRRARAAGEVLGDEGVDVDLGLEVMVVARRGRRAVEVRGGRRPD